MNSNLTLVITILNEALTIELLLSALLKQTVVPKEIILVDGGSSDETISIIKKFSKNNFNHHITKRIIIKVLPNSNRAEARNWAINQAKTELIAITDAGCIPQPSWLENLYKTYQKTKSPIVGGFFYGLPSNAFEQAVVAYTLQMPDKVDSNKFMPTTRSVLLTKKTWQKLGGFDEALTTNEDFPFFYHARQNNIKIAFAKNALVGWIPRKTINSFIKMIYGFAKGDLEAGIIRPKVQLLFGRYLFVILATFYLLFIKEVSFIKLTFTLGLWLIIYLCWAIWKNVRYTPQGWYWLPAMQLMADCSVMFGSIIGLIKRHKKLVSG